MKSKIRQLLSLTLAITLIISGIVFSPRTNVKATDFNKNCTAKYWKNYYDESTNSMKADFQTISGGSSTVYIHENEVQGIRLENFDAPGMIETPLSASDVHSYISFSTSSSKFSDDNVEMIQPSYPTMPASYGWTWFEFNESQTKKMVRAAYDTDFPGDKYVSLRTIAGGFYYEPVDGAYWINIRGKKQHESNKSSYLYVYKRIQNNNYIFATIKIVVIRSAPTKNDINVQTSLDGIQKSAIDKISLYPYKERDGEDNAKVTINIEARHNDYDMWQNGNDSFSLELAGSNADYFILEKKGDGDSGTGSWTLSTKDISADWSLIKNAYLKVTYNTWDVAFAYDYNYGTFDESANTDGFNTELKKFTVIKKIPIEIVNKNEIKGVPFYIGDRETKEEVKDGNIYISNKLSYPAVGEFLTVGDGYTIDSIKLTSEANKIIYANIYEEDYYYANSQELGEPPLYYKGECRLSSRNESAKGAALNGITVNIKKNGSISSYVFNAMVANDCYKLLDSEININKDSAIVNKINNLQGYININSLITDNKDYQKVIFNPKEATYSGYDRTIIEIEDDGTIIPRTLGSTTVKVTLPPEKVIGSNYQGWDMGPWSVSGWDEVDDISAYSDNNKYEVNNGKLGWFLCQDNNGKYYKSYRKDLDKSSYVNNINLTCNVKVNINRFANSIEVEPGNNANDYYKLTVGAKRNYSDFITVLDKNRNYENVSRKFNWFSEIPRIATVDENGNITAKAIGSSTITVKTTDGSDLENSFKLNVVTKPPQNIKTNDTKDGIKFTWNKDNEVASYNIYKCEEEYGEYEKIDSTQGTTYTDKDVSFGKHYYYKLTTTPKDDTSLESLETAIIKHKFNLSTPTLKSIEKEGSRVKVTISGEKYDGYILYYGTSKKPTTAQATLSSKTAEISLPKYGTYYFRVKSYATQDDKNYYSDYSNELKYEYSSNVTTSTILKGTVTASVKKGSIVIKIGKKRLKITKAVGKKIKLKSSNKKVLTISKTGKIKYKKKGKATVSFKYNGKKYKIKFVIKKKGKKKFKVTAKFKGKKYKFTIKR